MPPGRNPAANSVSSQPVTRTTFAPARRRCSARSAQSANSGASWSVVSSHGNGANHTSSPSAAASSPAVLSRPGSPPEIRTAVQRSSRAMTLHLAADDVGVEVLAAVVAARGEAGVVVDALAAHGGSPSGQDAAASASIIFWMGPAAAPPATMATPIEPSVMTVPSHTIVVTGRV